MPTQRAEGWGVRRDAMNDRIITDELARQVMNWGVHADRYVKSGRSWIPRWRFQPLLDIADAFQLLDRATEGYCLASDEHGTFTACVQVNGQTGDASGTSQARVIARAVARAAGLRVD